ncbi:MAG TPA: SLC13 family permease [Geminicoccaceae bacterium]|nr:SLC13 family permease [Geminicoccaceae bacterium]
MPAVEPTLHMWLTLALTGLAVVAYAHERLPVELTSLVVLAALMLLFQLYPLRDAATGAELLPPEALLSGFASPALVAVAALLVVGQAMVTTGALEGVARGLFRLGGGRPRLTIGLSLVGVTGVSGFLNNTPVVVIFIPILLSLAERFGRPAGQVMIPLSYCAILGGMTTLIGTSTNLLVSGELARLGLPRFAFFDLTVPGLVLVAAGGLYMLLLARWLPRYARGEPAIVPADGRQFIAEIDLAEGSPLVGQTSTAGMFPGLPDVLVRLIERQGRTILPPFEEATLQPGDLLIVAATRKVLTEMLARNPGQLLGRASEERPDDGTPRDPAGAVLAEVMVRPASRMIGQSLEYTNFPARSRCTVLGIQRRARMLRARMGSIRLEAGDVLLVLGRGADVRRLRADPDVLLMEWSASELPAYHHAPTAALIFGAVVLPAALDLVPIVITALLGVVALIVTGCIGVGQAARAVDRQIVLIVAAALAQGAAMEATGGAAYLAMTLLGWLEGAPPAAVLSCFFLLVSALTNVLSNNAAGVLFTPIAVNVARSLGVDPFPFALAVAFGASCAFATPIGYQTNLLVMGPGHYRFRDFIRAGLPLIAVLWLAFSLFVPWYYGL